MDLFLPIGFDAVVNAGGSSAGIKAGFVESTIKKYNFGLNSYYDVAPPDGESYTLATLLNRLTSPYEVYDPVIPDTKYAITVRKSPIATFTVYFGKTIYDIATGRGRWGTIIDANTLRKNIPSSALYDGIINVSFEDSNGKTLASGSANFGKYAFKTSITVNLNVPVADNAPGFIRWNYSSSVKNMFDACQVVPSSNIWPVIFATANQSLEAKDVQAGAIIIYGPTAIANGKANLTFTELINLRTDALCAAKSYCNAEVDTELNLRAGLSASATSKATLLGPLDLSAVASCQCAVSGNTTADISLVAECPQAISARGFAYVGTSVFLQADATATAKTKVDQDLIVSERVSGMTIYVNLDTREFVVSPVLTAPVTQMYFTRRDIEAIDVKFVRNGEVVELSYGATGQLGIKSEFDGAAIALDSEWSQKGAGSNAAYQFSLNLNTQELDDLFVTDEEASIAAKLELEWTEAGTINTTLPCAAIVLNDVLRGTEGAPTLATSNSFNLSDGSGGVWTVTVDANGILTTTKV